VNFAEIRRHSWDIAASLGFPKSDALPLLDSVSVGRSIDEIVYRIFAINCLAAVAYGFSREKARTWLEREELLAALTNAELDFLNGNVSRPMQFMEQIEAMWALSWSLSIASELDLNKPCAPDFVRMLPDLKQNETGAAFRARALLRNSDEIVEKCDLAYVLHWAVVETRSTRKMNKAIKPYIIIQRRTALEWLLSDSKWDEVVLDT
jgi:hypothetical protein